MTIATDTIAEVFCSDRFDHDWPQQVVPLAAKERKAKLIVRTAMELFAPDRYLPDMCLFRADVAFISQAYSVSPDGVAALVHTRASAMAEQWRRAAERVTA